MKKNDEEFDAAEYENELASLKRVLVQFRDLRKWLVNASLASLAFAFTVMFQVKGGNKLPHPSLAAVTLTFLIVATVGALWIRARNEFESLLADTNGFAPLLPVLRNMVINSPEFSDTEKHQCARHMDWAINWNKKETTNRKKASPHTELLLIGVEFLVFVAGLASLCLYLWLFLFHM